MSLRRRLQQLLQSQSGMATAELAVALVALSIVVSFLLAGGAVVAAQLQASDAARLAARLTARGESAQVVDNAVHQVAPHGRIDIVRDHDIVTVTARVSPSLALARRLVSVVTATARSVDETASTSATGER